VNGVAWSVKRAAGLLTVIYGLVAVTAVTVGVTTQFNWPRWGGGVDGDARTEIARVLKEAGTGARLDRVLAEVAGAEGYTALYVTEAPKQAVVSADDLPALSASDRRLVGSTWNVTDRRYQLSDRYWRSHSPIFVAGDSVPAYIVTTLKHMKSMPWTLAYQIALITAVAAWLSLATWLYQDAADRGSRAAAGWLVMGLLTGPMALAAWQITRPDRTARKAPTPEPTDAPNPTTPVCPACARDTIAGQAYCVRCGQPLRPVCGECHQLVELDWEYCGACGADLAKEEVSQ
jgi:hypothetical protein